ncbi:MULTISPECIES: glutathione synthase [unclassified Colwellia]|jgi:glutathione synthase|uniref:glutathione synthase n=1 Tax=unclassified Colwellia TaxID=196834 RepID=UPI0015F41FAF|nr:MULTISPECIES: glutathione synthase [unclassified Colwellia]MBA6231716.1 glutathione synthase [Colwellia sp. MB02u-7]MBA6235580.1 glutathione synthase [Colwellia sp. MB02u-11]MBA6254907.1 glutathione synthase [Colwellia sp. MB3u-28]MBA6259689.1 glutathione synthase [Colwellia sp. MB3u-41]MBA6264510.1 glutathione synthase [Colwellia sp. Bg11-12]
MTIKLGVVMDPISQVNVKKDSSMAMMFEAQKRGYEIYYMEMKDLYLDQGQCRATAQKLKVFDDPQHWYELDDVNDIAVSELDAVLMRKDPPFDTEFIYATYMLERAEVEGTLIVNKPQSLRDCNEKLFTAWFADLTPRTLVTRNNDKIREFHQKEKDIIIKPLDGMGGASIFRIKENDANVGVILETLTNHGNQYAMVQEFMPEIKDGDKRILIVNGEPMPYCLARIPAQGETRGNLAAGGRGEARPLSATDRLIAETIAPELKKRGLYFVGLDVIGDKVTEINVTSPTCIREIEAAYPINISGKLMDAIEENIRPRV